MSKTRLLLARAGAAAALLTVVLVGCGNDDAPADDPTSGDDASEEAGEDDDMADADAPDTDDGASDDVSDNDVTGDEGDGDVADAGDGVPTIVISVADGEATPAFDTYQVGLGDEVRIEVTSDVADELHMHGYDVELALEPGVPGVLEFTADVEGRFELETHETGLQLLQLEVQ